jgi:hypothetical protein
MIKSVFSFEWHVKSRPAISIMAHATPGWDTLYIVISQDSPTVRIWLKKHDVHFGTNFIMKNCFKPYSNTELFIDYINTVFLSNITELRNVEEFHDKDVVLLIDNCLSHVTDMILSLFRDIRVHVIIGSPHMTQIFQKLDISLFEVLK